MDATLGSNFLKGSEWLEEMKKSDPVQYRKHILVLMAIELYQKDHEGKGIPIGKDLTILFEYIAKVMMVTDEFWEECE